MINQSSNLSLSLYLSLSLSMTLIYHQSTNPLTWTPNHHQTIYISHVPKHVPYHVHQPCIRACTIPCTSNMYHTMYINHVHKTCTISCINHVPNLYRTMYINLYHTMHINHVCQPQHVPTSPRHTPHTYTKNMPHTMHQICDSNIYQCLNKIPRHGHHIINK
jgi:hypothetical protein